MLGPSSPAEAVERRQRKQVGELRTICLTGGGSHSALLWNARLWKEEIRHVEQETESALGKLIQTAMKSPVVYGNPVMFGPVDWNYAAGPPVRRGKSVEELGDAGWARERERIAHLQHLQQLHQLQLQQQQVGYPGYGGVPPGHPQGPVMVASPGDPVPVPVPVHGGVMVPGGVPMPPPVHMQAPWPVQWDNQAQIRPSNVCHPTERPPGQDVYFHPGSENGHLDVRISEWKGKQIFYQGPEDHTPQEQRRVPKEKDYDDFRTQEKYDKLDKERRRRDDWVRDNDNNADRHEPRSPRDFEEYDHRDKYRYRDHYDRKYNERYDDREQQQYDNRRHGKHDLREQDSYSSEYEDYHDHRYARRDDYRDSDRHYDHDRDYYDSRESQRYREKEYHQRREEDWYDEERKRKDRYAEDRYERRENNYKDRDVFDQRHEDTYTSKGRGRYDSEQDEYNDHKERDHYNRYRDTGVDRRDDDHRRRDQYKAREHYERRNVDHYRQRKEDHYDSREGDHYQTNPRGRYRDLRSMSVDSRFEDFPQKEHKTLCEKWVEQQNQKLALGEMHSFEDPVVYQHSEPEKGYESSTGSAGSKQRRKPVYVGSLDRNSFYRKTAPSSLRNSQFATTRKQKQGKQKDTVM